ALLVLLPAAGFLAHFYSSNRALAIATEVGAIRDYSRELATEIDAFFAAQQNLTHHANISAELRSFLGHAKRPDNQAEFSQWLKQWRSISDFVDEVFVLDASGQCVAATSESFIGQSYAFRPYFKQAIAGHDYASDWTVGITSKKPGLYFSAPIRFDRQIGGVLVIKVNPQPIDQLIRRSSSLGKQAFVVNEAGVILAHCNPQVRYASVADLTLAEQAAIAESRQFADMVQPSLKLDALRSDIAGVQARQTLTSRVYQFQGEQKIAALSGVQSRRWVAGVTVPFSSIEAPARQLLRSFMPLAGVILLFTVVSSFYVSRYLVKPLQSLLATMARFGSGEQLVRAPVNGLDEVSQLGKAFNNMAERIVRHTADLEDRVTERTQDLQKAFEEIKRISVTDPLTGCFNRRYLSEQLGDELVRSQRYHCPLSVLMCDIDFFKRVNDLHGHQAGDLVLAEVARILQSGLRQKIDWVARFGGEEFVLVLPQTTPEDAALMAERIRHSIQTNSITHDGKCLQVTASFGLSSCREDGFEST
ncbi:MAG: sensor domain-containing diguanylate cyclase, partial [Rhodoferax sp.]